MIDVFNINDLIYKMNVNMNVDSENSNQQTMKYKDVVDKIRHIISKYHSAELIDVIYSPSAGDTLKNLIIRYINQIECWLKVAQIYRYWQTKYMKIWLVLEYSQNIFKMKR